MHLQKISLLLKDNILSFNWMNWIIGYFLNILLITRMHIRAMLDFVRSNENVNE